MTILNSCCKPRLGSRFTPVSWDLEVALRQNQESLGAGRSQYVSITLIPKWCSSQQISMRFLPQLLDEAQVIEPVGAGRCKEQVAGSHWAHGGGFSGDLHFAHCVLPQLMEISTGPGVQGLLGPRLGIRLLNGFEWRDHWKQFPLFLEHHFPSPMKFMQPAGKP